MRAVIQRVSRAEITIDHQETREIGQGLVVFLGVMKGDTEAQAEFLAEKAQGLRIFTDENGTVTINGEVQQESYVVYQYAIPSEFDVPEGYYLFMGDNRANSMDSRYWQNPYVSGESIQGRAIFTLFPFSNFGKLQ